MDMSKVNHFDHNSFLEVLLGDVLTKKSDSIVDKEDGASEDMEDPLLAVHGLDGLQLLRDNLQKYTCSHRRLVFSVEVDPDEIVNIAFVESFAKLFAHHSKCLLISPAVDTHPENTEAVRFLGTGVGGVLLGCLFFRRVRSIGPGSDLKQLHLSLPPRTGLDRLQDVTVLVCQDGLRLVPRTVASYLQECIVLEVNKNNNLNLQLITGLPG